MSSNENPPNQEFRIEKIEEMKKQIREGKLIINYDVLVEKLESGPLADLFKKG